MEQELTMKEIIKQVLTKNARQHKSYLHSISGRPMGRTAELLLPLHTTFFRSSGGPLAVPLSRNNCIIAQILALSSVEC